ncbi:hypothetical protein HMPREF1603_00017 [Escherichia coli 907892]|nr:hypothetical protein HMPREF1603_00017 [Escherichia coli 907892]ESE00798.1 hypothetical protein HMPREF1615_04452 [Escherichia coli 908632]
MHQSGYSVVLCQGCAVYVNTWRTAPLPGPAGHGSRRDKGATTWQHVSSRFTIW